MAMLERGPPDFAGVTRHFYRDGVVTGCSVDKGRFHVFSDWRAHADGFGRIFVHGVEADVAPNKRTAAGKVLQRMIELDKY